MNGYDPDEWVREHGVTIEPYLGEINEEEEAAFRKFQEERRAANRAAVMNPTPEQLEARREWIKNLKVVPPHESKPSAE